MKNWRLRGLTSFAVFFYSSTYLPLIWDQYLVSFQLLDLTSLGTWGGGIFGIVLYEFGVYVWHRSMHSNNALWRTSHQMHHSAERVDTYGAFWFSPLDMIGWTALGSLCLVVIVGIRRQAATVFILGTTFLGVFQHTNIRTPQWLGYIVQRLESHSVHHQRGLHYYNFSDLPVFDILFGTFRNPQEGPAENSFYDGASRRMIDMMLFKDVSNAPLGRTRP
jgi:sterol desaturase/sphingolipid hydroxylase (fatty acid hydroxylase superfamily)